MNLESVPAVVREHGCKRLRHRRFAGPVGVPEICYGSVAQCYAFVTQKMAASRQCYAVTLGKTLVEVRV